MGSEDDYPKNLTNIPYSEESTLNTLDICIPKPLQRNDDDKFWLIYIHGGAWRDPAITSTSFNAIQSNLQSSDVSASIAAYASVNYRLSPYPSHPTDPSNPSDPARNAKHPDHVNDVLAAILYLQETYHFGDQYILVGHSIGATLALQVAMKRYWGSQYESTFALELNVVPPIGVVGLEGIYDIPALVEKHKDQPVYRDFVTNAVAPADWSAASPVDGYFEESWPDGQVVVLAHSPNDSLVEMEQTQLMRTAMQDQGFADFGAGERMVKMVKLKGDHDEVWQTGEASKAIEVAIRELIE